MTLRSSKRISSITLALLCQRWLELVAIAHIFGGLSLSFNWPVSLWSEYRYELFQVFKLTDMVSDEINAIVEMLTQLFGPTVASWGILMFYLVRQVGGKSVFHNASSDNSIQFYNQEKSVALRISSADILILATLLWFVLDFAISMNFGMILHLIINTAAILSILLPLIFLRLKLLEKGASDYATYRIEN